MGSRGLAKVQFVCTSGHFINFPSQYLLVKLQLAPLPMEVGVLHMNFVCYLTFSAILNIIQKDSFFIEFDPNFTFWRGNP